MRSAFYSVLKMHFSFGNSNYCIASHLRLVHVHNAFTFQVLQSVYYGPPKYVISAAPSFYAPYNLRHHMDQLEDGSLAPYVDACL